MLPASARWLENLCDSLSYAGQVEGISSVLQPLPSQFLIPSFFRLTFPLLLLLLQPRAEAGSLWCDVIMLVAEEAPEHLGLGLGLTLIPGWDKMPQAGSCPSRTRNVTGTKMPLWVPVA